jgi:pimeloyl-ACP methyl ester carboxylesterase
VTGVAQFTTVDGVRLDYEIEGQGAPVLWQHGLGATAAQPAEVFPKDAGLQRITLLCRGHGGSSLGPLPRLSIRQFANDAVELLDHLKIEHAAVGGISLGAAIALNIAARRPGRVNKLVLARPAWLDLPAPETMELYSVISRLLAAHGENDGLHQFQNMPEYLALRSTAPDNASSLVSFFTRPRPETTISLLSTIPFDGPDVTRLEMAALKVPALVIGNGQDYVHPLSYAKALAAIIPGAQFREITSKSVDKRSYLAEFREALTAFLHPN